MCVDSAGMGNRQARLHARTALGLVGSGAKLVDKRSASRGQLLEEAFEYQVWTPSLAGDPR